jgi:Na+-driven multidrug efflux pump
VSFALDGILIGAGDLRFLAAAMVAAGLGFAALAAVVLAAGLGLGALWAAVIAFMAMRAVGLGARFRTGRWAQVGTALSGSGSTPTP